MKFKSYRHLSREEFMRALQIYDVPVLVHSQNEDVQECIKFRSMVFEYLKRDLTEMTKHYETCFFCRDFIEALNSIKSAQKTLCELVNGDHNHD